MRWHYGHVSYIKRLQFVLYFQVSPSLLLKLWLCVIKYKIVHYGMASFSYKNENKGFEEKRVVERGGGGGFPLLPP